MQCTDYKIWLFDETHSYLQNYKYKTLKRNYSSKVNCNTKNEGRLFLNINAHNLVVFKIYKQHSLYS